MTNILYLDIETSPNLAYTWGKWKQDVIQFEQVSYMLAISWVKSTIDENGRETFEAAEARGLCDFKDYDPETCDDARLCQLTLDLIDWADFIVGHNVDKFDLRRIKGFAVKNDLNPPSTYLVLDTLKMARKEFAFQDNRLGALCDYLGLATKESTGGFSTWLGCMGGDRASWETMLKYAKQDVEILPALYHRLRPWVTNHPVLVPSADRNLCPKCASSNMVRNGTWRTKTGSYQRWHCRDCGGYSRSRLAGDHGPKPEVV